jgi:hypothetical protein
MGFINSEEGDANALVQLEELVFHGDGSLRADVYDAAFTRQSLFHPWLESANLRKRESRLEAWRVELVARSRLWNRSPLF